MSRPALRLAARLSALGFCLFGAVTLGQGLWIPVKAAAAQHLLDRAFDEGRAAHRRVRPWASSDSAPVARIRVPRLGVSQVVLDGGSGQAMAFGPTVLPGGAELGAAGTTILAAHRDTHFAFLKDVRPSDMIEVETVTGERLYYRMTGSRIVRWNEFAFDPDPATPRLLLTSCYPFDADGHGPLRFVGEAERIDVPAPAHI